MSKTCYWITGNEMPQGFAPCNPDAANSPCCMIDKANPDICLSSGLCYSQTDDYEGFLYINGCTDKTGKAKECPQMCDPPSHTNANSLDVLECSRGVYCCRDFGTSGNCCSDSSALLTTGIGKLIVAAKTAPASSGATSATTSPTTATTTSGSAPAATSCSNSSSAAMCPKGNGAVIGGAVGGTLGAALLASLAALAFLYKRRSNGHKNTNAAYNEYKSPTQHSYASPMDPHQRAAELPEPVHELPTKKNGVPTREAITYITTSKQLKQNMPEKRTLDAFFAPSSKKPRESEVEPPSTSKHSAYPFDIADFPASLAKELSPPILPAKPGQTIDDKQDLDLLYFDPFVPKPQARQLFEFLRAELPYYRVEYKIKRGGIETDIKTPRWTTVFGLDETSRFKDGRVVDAKSEVLVSDGRYDRYPPRPIPQCLETLRRSTEAATGCKFNFCLVNYYASGADSISYHSDDERFLGPDPAIASFSFGAQRDFLMKHKTAPESLKLALGSGDMVLMRGQTQSRWLHSIPKRTGKNSEDGGRINITFRRAMTKDGTENYYNYNVGRGPVYRWDKIRREMRQRNER